MSLLRIDKILAKKGISRKELADKTNVSQNTISNIVLGKNFPKPELLKNIAEVLDVDIRELFIQTKLPEYDQKKHEQLVKVINIIQGKDLYNIKTEPIHISELTDTNDINNAIKLALDVLNISSGSTGEYDLYKLMKVYLLDSEKRKEINLILGY